MNHPGQSITKAGDILSHPKKTYNKEFEKVKQLYCI